MDALHQFLNSPAVAGIWSLLVIAGLSFVFAVYRSISGGYFDPHKLPQILDTLVVQKVFPLTILGVASYAVTDPTTQTALLVAYGAAYIAALAAEVQSLLDAVTGTTQKAMNTPLNDPITQK